MALTLTVKEGMKIYINDVECLVQEICSISRVKLKVNGKPFPCIFTCNKIRAVEILPNVKCSVVNGGDRSRNTIKIVLEAPINIEILREELYIRSKELE